MPDPNPSLDGILAEVDTWFAEELQRPPISYDSECYDQSHKAWQSLRNRLAMAITGNALVLPPVETPGEPVSASGDASSGSSSGAEGATKAPKTPKPQTGV